MTVRLQHIQEVRMLSAIYKEFDNQEKEDLKRMTVCFETAIREELDRPERYIRILAGRQYQASEILKLSVKDTPVRVASEISIRKHTLCQIPYYHTHDFYELIYVYQGKGAQYLAGKKELLQMETGDICLLTPGKIHAMVPSGTQDIVLKLVLPKSSAKEILAQFRQEDGLREWAGMAEKRNQLYVYHSAGMNQYSVKWLMEALMLNLYQGQNIRSIAVRSLLNLLFVELAQWGKKSTDRGFLDDVMDYMQNNMMSADLDRLASKLGYSSRHCARRIFEETGGNFSELLTHIRIQKAADLLSDTELPVEEVACLTGYRSVSGLYKRFHAVYGMSPGAYRKRCRKESEQ